MTDDDNEIWRELGVGRRRAGIPLGPNQWRPGDAAPSITVNGREIRLVREEGARRLKHSKFEVTISSNVRYSGILPEKNRSVEAAIKGASDWLFSRAHQEREDFLDIFDIWRGARGNTRKTGEHPNRSDIASITWSDAELEYGTRPKGRRIHYHGILSVYHYTSLRVNQKRVQGYINNMTTRNRNQYIWPSPPRKFFSEYIKGTYVHARSIDNETQAIYNKKSLINPYIEHLKNLARPS